MTRERWGESVSTVAALTLGAVLVAVVATLIATLWTAAGGGAPGAGPPVRHYAQAQHVPQGRPKGITVTEATARGGLGLQPPPGPARSLPPGEAAGASPTGAGNPGRSFAPPPPCGTDPSVIGYAGVVRAGQTAAARLGLGPALLAQVRDADGQLLDIARTAGGLSSTELARYFTRWRPIHPVARQVQLRSCSDLTAGTPAGRQVLSAAMAAVVRARYFRSAARLRSVLQMVVISDNPVARHSLIVTLMVPGPAGKSTLRGRKSSHPTPHLLVSETVLMRWPHAAVTGVARGGL